MDLTKFLPLPELLDAKAVLCVMPHPDDNEIGAGGTIARLVDAGAKVTYLGVTDGGAGTLDPSLKRPDVARIRRGEQGAAAAALGVSELIWLDYPDAVGLPAAELRQRIVGVIRQVRPEFVLTVDPWLPYEAHPDHRAVGMAVAEAALLSGFPNIHPEHLDGGVEPHAVTAVAFYATAAPNRYVAIDATWERKLAAIQKHASQFNETDWQLLVAYLDMKAQELAAKAGVGARAEGFKVLTPTYLHMCVDTVEC